MQRTAKGCYGTVARRWLQNWDYILTGVPRRPRFASAGYACHSVTRPVGYMCTAGKNRGWRRFYERGVAAAIFTFQELPRWFTSEPGFVPWIERVPAP